MNSTTHKIRSPPLQDSGKSLQAAERVFYPHIHTSNMARGPMALLIRRVLWEIVEVVFSFKKERV